MKPIALLQNWPIETADNISEFLKQQRVEYLVCRTFEGEQLPDPATLEAAVMLGCPISVTAYREHDFLKNLYAFAAAAIRRDLPLLGICYGGQLIADILGAKVEANPVKEIGVYTVKLTEEGTGDSIFEGFESQFKVFHWHGDTFKIPRGATFLAEGDDCKNQSFRKGKSVAVQFHLEVNEHDLPQWCDEYSGELRELNKTKEQILEQYKAAQSNLRASNARLLRNWLKSW